MPFTAKVISATDAGLKPKGPFDKTVPKFIIIHHTASENPPSNPSKGTLDGAKQYARDIQKFHIDSFGFNDSGHNFLNTTAGVLVEGRNGSLSAIKLGRCIRSAHAGNNLGNESPGIENEGNFMTHQMDKTQWDSLVELCASICESCHLSPSAIKGHCDFSPTKCPGDWLYGQLARLRDDVAKKLGVSVDDNTFLREGSTGSEVTKLQNKLKEKGFLPGPIDGIFGPATEAAVIAFQRTRDDLDDDGIVGPLTKRALGL